MRERGEVYVREIGWRLELCTSVWLPWQHLSIIGQDRTILVIRIILTIITLYI